MFCWTKFGTEAGEAAEAICRRKEIERSLNGGVFLWGIGHGIGPSLRRLLELERAPVVLFTPMLTTPKRCDVVPEEVVKWTVGKGLNGSRFDLPAHSVVTSRGKRPPQKERHYALVCRSSQSLLTRTGLTSFAASDVVNLLSGRPVGASQVTSVVRDLGRSTGGPYAVSMAASLTPPYFVELGDPLHVDSETLPSLVA